MKTRTEITVEMDRLIVVTRTRKTEWCGSCSRLQMLTADDAELVTQRFSDLPELAETLSALIGVIQSHPWPVCPHQSTQF
jgi:hypothetical protein